VVTCVAKLLQTHPGGNGIVVVGVATGAGVGAGGGVKVLGSVLGSGAVVVVVVVGALVEVTGSVFTCDTAPSRTDFAARC
jgi:hypothetical protein